MKLSTNILAIALTAVLAFACAPKIEDALTLSSSEYTVNSTGAKQTLSFTSNVPWTVASSADWITFDKTSGEAGTVSVSMAVAANTDFEQRTGTVTITAGTKTSVIKVTQTQLESFDAIVTYNISSEAQDVVYELTSNISYTYTVDAGAQSWISSAASTKAAPVSGKLTFTVQSNTGVAARSGKVYIKTAQYSYCMVINQSADFTTLTSAGAMYLGNAMHITDDEGNYQTFQEYLVTLQKTDDYLTVNLAINTKDVASPMDALPVGTFEVDAAANHAANTFSIKPTDGSESFYTAIHTRDYEINVEDGEVKIEKTDTGYVISALLIDQTGKENKYYYCGPIGQMADARYAAKATSASFTGKYNTYYASGVNQWNVTLLANFPIEGSKQQFHYITFNLNGPSGDVDGSALPTGTFMLDTPQNDTDLTWANGTLKAQSNTMSDVYMYDTDADGNSNYYHFGEGAKVIVEKNADGSYNFSFHGTAALYTYDENYNLVKTGNDFNYDYTYPDVKLTVDTESSLVPHPDGDVAFSTVMQSQYVGLWWGKAYKDKYNCDASVFTIGFNYVNGDYTVYLTLVEDSTWTWTGNFGNKSQYCSTPFATGMYSFSKAPVKMNVVPCSYSYISNGYSGTKCAISGGNIVLADGKCYYTLTVTNPNDASVTYKVTGSHDATPYYFRDNSGKSKAVIAITE